MSLKRSTINRSIDQAIETFAAFSVRLPPFAFWTVEQWQHKGPEVAEIRECMLGWDVTDFGSGDFERLGRTLFTVRNGSANRPQYRKAYAEKVLFDPPGQRAPAHFHRSKMEDIVVRAGGNILVQLRAADEANRASSEPLQVQVDGETVHLEAGGVVRIGPGQSLCIPPRTIHQFWGEEGTGLTVSSEISSVCNDLDDNYFLDPAQRFPPIEEDEPRRYYLCHEYPAIAKQR